MRPILRRHVLRDLVAVAALASTASALAFPDGPVRLIVPFAPGGGTDTIARVVAQALSKRLGQQVIVDNRAGGGGSIGTMAVAQAPADGHTLLLGSNGTMVLNPLLAQSLKYKVGDFTSVGGIAQLPFLVVAHPQFEAKDVPGLLTMARARPGAVTFASPGSGTTNHLVGVLLESMGGVDMNHIPYRGAAPAMNDVVSGQVNFMSGDLGTLLPMVKSGKLRALALTGPQRTNLLPDVPAVAEAIPGFEALGWFGLMAPRGTPAPVVSRLSVELAQALTDAEVLSRLREIGGSPLVADSAGLNRLIDSETRKWQKLIVDRKITSSALQ
jgi:tripartite-type tricarboxylate transporter receptor subunit TctC